MIDSVNTVEVLKNMHP